MMGHFLAVMDLALRSWPGQMTDLPAPPDPFEDLGIALPDYVNSEGDKASQPFSRSRHDLLRRETPGSKGGGGEERTGYFKEQLIAVIIKRDQA